MNVALVRSASQGAGGLGATTNLPASSSSSGATDPVMKKREEQQRQRAIKVFDDHDEDKSGTIDVYELPHLADCLGLPIEEGDVDAVMEEMDKDKSGKLEKEEFVRWWLDRVLPPDNYRRQQEVIARNVFLRSGGGDDGRIDIKELEDLAADLGLPLSPEELAKAMGRLDTNGDGTLEQEEFVTWWVEKSMNWEVDDELSKKLRKLAETARRRLSTDIFTAVWQGDVMLVEEFLKADPALVNAEDSSEYGGRYRPLHYAAYQGNLHLCRFLVQNGAKVMAPTSTGCHAIFLAAQQNHPEVVKFLLDEGADPSMCDTEAGLCAVDVAEYSKEALQVFRECGRLAKPDKPPEAPELRLAPKGEGLELHFPEAHRTGPFQLPIQELKVKIMKHHSGGEGGGGGGEQQQQEEETMASLGIFPAKTTPIVLKGLHELTEYRVQVAYINGLGAGPYSDLSNIMKTGAAIVTTKATAATTTTTTEEGEGGGDKENDAKRDNNGNKKPAPTRSSSFTSIGSHKSSSSSTATGSSGPTTKQQQAAAPVGAGGRQQPAAGSGGGSGGGAGGKRRGSAPSSSSPSPSPSPSSQQAVPPPRPRRPSTTNKKAAAAAASDIPDKKAAGVSEKNAEEGPKGAGVLAPLPPQQQSSKGNAAAGGGTTTTTITGEVPSGTTTAMSGTGGGGGGDDVGGGRRSGSLTTTTSSSKGKGQLAPLSSSTTRLSSSSTTSGVGGRDREGEKKGRRRTTTRQEEEEEEEKPGAVVEDSLFVPPDIDVSDII